MEVSTKEKSSTPTGLLYGTPTSPPFQCFGSENALKLFPQSQIVFVNIIIVLVLAIKHVVSHTETGIVNVDLNSECKTLTADFGLGIKHGPWYKTRTEHYGLDIKHVVRYITRTAKKMRPTNCNFTDRLQNIM